MSKNINASVFQHSDGFHLTYLSEAYRILIASYSEMLTKNNYTGVSCNENKLRDDLIKIAETKESNLKFEWVTESRNLVKSNRIDVTLITPYSLGLGFEKQIGIECKIVGVDSYVNGNGIISFISGKYTSQMPIAGMIGFITVPTVKSKVDEINKKLKEHTQIKTNKYLLFYKFVDGFNESYHSNHDREKQLPSIDIYHLMFDCSSII